jgi:cupin fold WbuC family metalloprotein
MLNELSCAAKQSPRARQHLNIHQSYSEQCQRLFNALDSNTYIRPHRHSLDPKVESLFAIRGAFAVVTFDEQGKAERVVRAAAADTDSSAAVGVELPPATWHTVVALTDSAVLLELKAGPFDPDAAKEFAPWAPAEGTPAATEYLHDLKVNIAAVI